jgi:hypothetical protein
MRKLGLDVDVEAEQHDIPGLVEAICDKVKTPSSGVKPQS